MLGDVFSWVLGIGCWLLGVNSLAVIAFHHDKRMAQSGGWRISEQTLLTIALFGGSVGAQLHTIVGLQFFALTAFFLFGVIATMTPWLR